MKKKLFSIIMCVLMVMCFMPTAAFATDCSGGDTCTHEAAIGTTHYASLQDAISAAANDTATTIKLLKDVTLIEQLKISSGTITLDLNGKTINVTKGSNDNNGKPLANNLYITGTANLTIEGNGKISGPNESDCNDLDTRALIGVDGTSANLTVLNGNITAGGKVRNGMYGIYISNGGNVTLGNSEEGPTIETWFAAVGENNTTSPANITIKNGTYTQKANPVSGNDVSKLHYLYAAVYASASGNINIEGGTFSGYYGISSN